MTREEEFENQVYVLKEALRLTQEYIGDDLLPPIRGWSWYDALYPVSPHNHRLKFKFNLSNETSLFQCADCNEEVVVT